MNICYIAGYYYSSNDGIGRYTHNLISELQKLDSNIQVQVIADGGKTSAPVHVSAKPSTKPARAPLFPPFVHKMLKPVAMEYHYFSRFRKTQTVWAAQLRSVEADVFHAVSPSEAVPAVLAGKKPLVTTFHDIIPLLNKPRYMFERVYFQHYSTVAKRSEMIIADSNQTKKDLISVLNIPKEKIVVVYPGIDTKKFSPTKKMKKDVKTILFQGGLVRRKGVFEVVNAFAKVFEKRTDIKLQIGGGGDETFSLKQEVRRLGIEKNVEFLGFVPDDELPKRYQEADVFVYPSQYEGFGYTPLEAMACGTPVITSNTSSIPEVVGDAAIQVNPIDTEALATEINNVLTNTKLQEKMALEGPLVANSFNLHRCALDTLKVYKEL